jgi:membrane protease YdiL (CAAX protease family)
LIATAAGRRGVPSWAWPCALALLVLAAEWGRALSVREWPLAGQLAGGALLCTAAFLFPTAALGLGRDRLWQRVLGGLALTVVLLLPAAVRWTGALPLSGGLAVAITVVAVGEELAFRGALFAAFERAWGGWAAVLGTTALWTLAHALSHPPSFLLAVAGAGLVLGCWRLYARDLVGPVIAHVLADLTL